jgi:two-component system sensor kinase FixL
MGLHNNMVMNEQLANSLDRKYRIALAVVAMLVLSNGVLIQPYIMRLTTDAPLINAAGRQRMLSQRLAKAALAVGAQKSDRSKAYLQEMSDVLELWSSAHERLLRGDAPAFWSGPNSEAVRAGLLGLEPHFLAMRDAARGMVRAGDADPPDIGAFQDALGVILQHEAEYLRRMDRVVGLYEGEAQGRVDNLRRVSWVVTGLTLATLAAIGVLILRPAARLIRRQVFELGHARDELEARVHERAKELEVAQERHRTLLEQFSHVGRTSTIGEMASALAHELNQPLGAIANYAEGCLIELSAPQPALGEVRAALGQILAATMRSGRIIEQVRRFVTRQGPVRESFDPNLVVNEVVEILGVEAQQRAVAVSVETAPGLPSLRGDPVQIQQVLVNLVRNSFESLAQSQTPEPALVIKTRLADRGVVEFAVSDNGEGIPADQIVRVFDAYFSTRANGMGMGLAISRTIVETHQGRFAVESDPGVKTTFRFSLPVDQDDHGTPDDLHRGR